MVKGRTAKTKQRYFKKDYAPARAAALRSSKTSTRLRAQLSEQVSKASKSITSYNKKTSAKKSPAKRTVSKNQPLYRSIKSTTNTTRRKSSRTHKSMGSLTWREVTLLSSIGVCAFTIVFTFVYTSIFDPVKRGNKELEKISNSYYIEYYYPRILGKYLNQPEKILATYKDGGLPIVKLRQLLSSNNGKYAGSSEAFSNTYYECDIDNSYVRFYPQEPYGPRDYTITYNTDCIKPDSID